MGYSLRTRSASTSEIKTPKKAVANKPAVKKAAPAKKAVEIKKAEKKTETKKIEKKTEIEKVADAKKPAETKKPADKKATAPKPVAKKAEVKAAPAKAEGKKVELKDVPVKAAGKTEPKKAAPIKAAVKKSPARSSPVEKATTKPSSAKKSAPAKSSATKKATTISKPAAKKAASALKKSPIRKIAAPIVKIEEISTPSLPEIETICHEEPEEKIIENVEGQVVSTHIRFSDDEAEDVEMSETVEASKEISAASSDFEALDDMKEEPTHFELYNSESETEEFEKFDKVSKDEFDEEETIKDVKKESPIINAHSAFDAFTSQEGPKTFNWSNSGSTYYQKPAELVEETKAVESVEEKPVAVEVKSTEAYAPTVISNPFGFGFTSTNVSVSSAPNPVDTSRPNSFSFNSHFQSISSPLDKLCNLTSKANPLPINSTNFSFGTSSMGTSSFLPTSPAAGFNKAVKSPSDHGEAKEERSPSVIQSIIIDDKHEDFSAF